jgi:hypothetical protein
MPYPFSSGEILTNTNLNNAFGVLTTWSSPVSSGITVGTGGAETASYMQIGKLVIAVYRLVFSGSGTPTAITGPPTFNLPVNAVLTDSVSVSGSLVDNDAVATPYLPVMRTSSSTTVLVSTLNASGTYGIASNITSTVPFTWASLDEMNLQFLYLAV